MKYRCMIDFRTIKKGDIVDVEIAYSLVDTMVYITKDRHTHITNEFILEEHFMKKV